MGRFFLFMYTLTQGHAMKLPRQMEVETFLIGFSFSFLVFRHRGIPDARKGALYFDEPERTG